MKPLLALLTCLTLAVPALAQEPVSTAAGTAVAGPLAEGPPLVFKPSALLQEQIPGQHKRDLPVFIQADRISGRADIETRLEGDAVMRRGDIPLRKLMMAAGRPHNVRSALPSRPFKGTGHCTPERARCSMRFRKKGSSAGFTRFSYSVKMSEPLAVCSM